MHTSLEDRDKILHGCGDHNVLSLDKKFHCPLAAEGACDHSLWGCYDLCNEATKLYPMGWVSWVKAEISRMFTNFFGPTVAPKSLSPPSRRAFYPEWRSHVDKTQVH